MASMEGSLRENMAYDDIKASSMEICGLPLRVSPTCSKEVRTDLIGASALKCLRTVALSHFFCSIRCCRWNCLGLIET